MAYSIPAITARLPVIDLAPNKPSYGDREKFVVDVDAAYAAWIAWFLAAADIADQHNATATALEAALNGASLPAAADIAGFSRGSSEYIAAIRAAGVTELDVTTARRLLAYNIARSGDAPLTEWFIAEDSPDGPRWGGALISALAPTADPVDPADPIVPASRITTPASGSRLSGTETTFSGWAAVPGRTYRLLLGTTAGASDIRAGGAFADVSSISATDIPRDDSAIHATLEYSDDAGQTVRSTATEYRTAAAPPDATVHLYPPAWTGQLYQDYAPPGVGNTLDLSHGMRLTGITTQGAMPYPRRLSEHRASYDGRGGRMLSRRGGTNVPVIDADTRAVLGTVGLSRSCPSWVEPGRLWGITSGGNLARWDYDGGTTTVLAGVGDSFGFGEGAPSIDDRYVVTGSGSQTSNSTVVRLIETGATGETPAIVSQRTVGQILTDSQSVGIGTGGQVDWVGVSKGGDYIVAVIKQRGFIRYDLSFANPVRVQQGSGSLRGQHADFFVGPNGEDCLAIMHWYGGVFVDLAQVDRVMRFDIPSSGDGYGHCSGTGILRGGWIIKNVDASDETAGPILGVYLDPANYGTTASNSPRFPSDYLGETIAPNAQAAVELWGWTENASESPPAGAATNAHGDRLYFEHPDGVTYRLERV